MKKILIFIISLMTLNSYAANKFYNGTIRLVDHTANGTYEGHPMFVVSANETLCFTNVESSDYTYANNNTLDGQAANVSAIQTSLVSHECIHRVDVSTWKDNFNGDRLWYLSTAYFIINTSSQSTCSKTSKTIIIWDENITRWERSLDGGQNWTNINCNTYSYIESSPIAGSAKYRVLKSNETYSDVVTITYVDAVPSSIQTLPASNTKTVDESITLTANVTDNGYSYQWKKDGNDIPGANSSTYKISAIKTSHAGNYTCYVSNGCNGVSSTNANLTVNKCNQTIDFPEIPTQTYSYGLTYTLPKTTNKGLTITYQSMNTNIATISGNILTIKAPGTTIISATQVGDANYNEATQVSRTLTINKRTQVISFDALPTKTYGDLPFTLPQTTNEGLTISYSVSNTSVAMVSGNTVTILKPGTTDIIASQAGDDTHYAATEVAQTLTVKKAKQTITFGEIDNKTYGDAPFMLNKVSDKNLEISYVSSNPSIASISGNTVTILKPGVVSITATQAGNAYYLPADSVTQSLTIKKASQEINFPDIESRAYGSADFSLTETTDKGETIAYTSNNTKVATVSGNIVHIVGAGSTTITASQTGNDYYNAASSKSQTFTVTKAYQTISFDSLPQYTFGQTPITLTGTVNSSNTVEYESSDYSVATIDGNQLTIVGAGQCYITASVPGDANHYTATPIERTLKVNKAVPTITFAEIQDRIYGDAPIELQATASNGADISFISSAPQKLMIFGSQAVIQGAGSYTIVASISEQANYIEATATQTFKVTKAPLTVKANNFSREYGENNPSLTSSFAGFVNGDSKNDLSAAIQITTQADHSSPVGTYEITVTASEDDNYQITCKKGVLTITKASLTIGVEDVTKIYGDTLPVFTIKYDGFKNDESERILSALPQAFTIAKQMSNVGEYPIYLSGASATNYSISYSNGNLTIVPAHLTITAQNLTKEYGDENPKFELVYTGFIGEEDENDLDYKPKVSSEASKTSNVGEYPIIVSDASSSNYSIEYVKGILTITPALLHISAKDITRNYGEENPTLEIEYSGFKNKDDANSLQVEPVIETSASILSEVGEYPIIVSNAQSKNYQFDYHNGILRVDKAILIISANNKSKTYGDPNPTFSMQFTGLKLGEDSTILSKMPTFICSAGKMSPVGQYPIQLEGGEAANYAISYIDGSLDITPAEIYIVVVDTVIPYGDLNMADIEQLYNILGLVGNDTLISKPIVTTNALQNSPVGYYETYISNYQVSENYIISPSSRLVGSLYICKTPLKIQACNLSKLHLEDNPPYRLSYSGFKLNDDESVLEKLPTIRCKVDKYTSSGQYPIELLDDGFDQNYEYELMNGIFTVLPLKYTIQILPSDPNKGTVSGTGTYEEESEIQIYATAKQHYAFTQWNDGNLENPRTIRVRSDSTFIAEFTPQKYNIRVDADKTFGQVTGGGQYAYMDNIQIEAIPNEHCQFVMWNDGATVNPRTITVTKDAYYNAIFAIDQHTIKVSAVNGTVTGRGTYNYGTQVTLSVTPSSYYQFKYWSDGNTDNPRTIVLTQDTSLIAFSDKIKEGKCGNKLTWQYNDNGILVLSGTGEMYNYAQGTAPWMHLFKDSITSLSINNGATSIGDNAFNGLTNKAFNSLVIPNSVEQIGQYAFANCNYLKYVYLGSSLEEISSGAFVNDGRLLYITCYAIEPPLLDESAFVHYFEYLSVPCEAQTDYEVSKGWNSFFYSKCIGDDVPSIESDTVTVITYEFDAVFTWPVTNTAGSYTLEITKEGVTFCTLTFNAQGQLTGLSFAPSRGQITERSQTATQTSNGFSFMVTGLDIASAYAFKMDVKDSNNKIIKSYKGEFYTKIANLNQCANSTSDRFTKIIRNNQLLILRDGKTYNAQGGEVR